MDEQASKAQQPGGNVGSLTKQMILHIAEVADRRQKAEQAFMEARYADEEDREISTKEAAYKQAYNELLAMLEALGESALMDLQAIMYLGRGAYTKFSQARQEIREEIPWDGLKREAFYCAGKLPLGEYLREGMKKMKLDDWFELNA